MRIRFAEVIGTVLGVALSFILLPFPRKNDEKDSFDTLMNMSGVYRYFKMDGIGNDFVIIDMRHGTHRLSQQQIITIATRTNTTTKGCDQVIVMEQRSNADVFMRIYNPDGTESSACGNATRCVAWLLMEESGNATCTIQTLAGLLHCTRKGGKTITVNMGEPKLEWKEIPLSQPVDTLSLPITEGALSNPVAVNMGNPHMVFFVPDATAVDLATLGAKLEHHPLFPERANVSVAEIIISDLSPPFTGGAKGGNVPVIHLNVWERGVGLTLACGTAACATLVAAVRCGLISGRKAEIILPGGNLEIEWLPDNHVLMTGDINMAFEGTVRL